MPWSEPLVPRRSLGGLAELVGVDASLLGKANKRNAPGVGGVPVAVTTNQGALHPVLWLEK
jgi:hypothetical protein